VNKKVLSATTSYCLGERAALLLKLISSKALQRLASETQEKRAARLENMSSQKKSC